MLKENILVHILSKQVSFNSCTVFFYLKKTYYYSILLANRNGTDEVQVQITVLGKPEKPNGPLDVSDVHAEGVTLNWKKPSGTSHMIYLLTFFNNK